MEFDKTAEMVMERVMQKENEPTINVTFWRVANIENLTILSGKQTTEKGKRKTKSKMTGRNNKMF